MKIIFMNVNAHFFGKNNYNLNLGSLIGSKNLIHVQENVQCVLRKIKKIIV